MSLLDIIIIVIFLIGFILGFKDGFVRKVVGFFGFVIAVLLTSFFYARVGAFLESMLGMDIYLANIVAGIMIFIITMAIFSFLKRVIHPFDKVNNFLNQILGGVIGAIQIIFFLGAVFFLLNVFSVPNKSTADSSLLYYKVYNLIPETIELLNTYTPKTKEILNDYINETDSLK
ncbi:MAG TPA: CvpA family protein [Ignavibacteriaceae bacterium]|nr:CvpA family protein [Ignavibacteriaceae bacterium]